MQVVGALSEAVGLRERKRAETRYELERAATRIALRDGVDGATVDEISAAANVSPRTFFNYFDTKEDAILGIRDTEVTAQTVHDHAERYRNAGALESVVGLLFDVLAPTALDQRLHASRVELAKRHPNLLARQIAQMSRMSTDLVAAIDRILTGTPSNEPPGPDGSDLATAGVVFGICGSAFRAAIKEWIDAGGSTAREQLESRTVLLVREAMEKLQ